jgi:Zn-dependent alcohol dehydrogenase
VPELVKEYEAGTTKLDDYITHRLPFTRINGGAGRGLRGWAAAA